MATQILVAEDRETVCRRYQQIYGLAETEDIPDSLNPAWLIGTPDEVEGKIRAYVEAASGTFCCGLSTHLEKRDCGFLPTRSHLDFASRVNQAESIKSLT